MRVKINIDTQRAAYTLVGLATGLQENVYLTDGKKLRVSAKSLLGALHAAFDFNEVWLETENEHYFLFKDFIVEE